MESTLEAIQVFANSANTVRVFEALTDGPTTSRDLAEQAGASRSTVARILDEGESRGWIVSTGSEYELTYLGQIMIDEFRTYLQTVESARQLGEAINYLPKPAHDLDIQYLGEANIVTMTEDNPHAGVERWLEMIRAADTYRGLTTIAPPIFVNALSDRIKQGGLDMGGVIEASVIETLREDPERAAPWHAFAEYVRVYDGRVPLNMLLIDGTVLLGLDHIDGNLVEPRGTVESEHPAVVAWAKSLYEEYWSEAEPLDLAVLPKE